MSLTITEDNILSTASVDEIEQIVKSTAKIGKSTAQIGKSTAKIGKSTAQIGKSTAKIEVNGLYSAFRIPPLSYVIMYRLSDSLFIVRKLLLMLIKNGADVNMIVQDTDDEYTSPLITAFNMYLGACMFSDDASKKDSAFSVMTLLLESGADPKIVLPDGKSIAHIIETLQSHSECNISQDDWNNVIELVSNF